MPDLVVAPYVGGQGGAFRLIAPVLLSNVADSNRIMLAGQRLQPSQLLKAPRRWYFGDALPDIATIGLLTGAAGSVALRLRIEPPSGALPLDIAGGTMPSPSVTTYGLSNINLLRGTVLPYGSYLELTPSVAGITLADLFVLLS